MKRSSSTAPFCIVALLVLGLSGCAATQKVQSSASNLLNNEKGYERLIQRQQASMPEEMTAAKKLPQLNEEDFERLGDSYFQQGKLEMAFLKYNKVLRKKPDNIGVLYKRGMILLYRNKIGSAVNDFEAILKKEPSNELGHQGMGQVLFKVKRYEEAEKHFQQAVKSDPKLWVSFNFLGMIYDYQQRPDAAVEQYRAAIAIQPNEGSLYNNLGIAYSLMRDYEKAVEAFRQGLMVKPRDGKIGNNLGLVLCKLGRHFEAIDAFKIGGDEAQAYNNVGSFHLQQGEYEKAVRAFEKAIELRSSYYPQASENLRKAEAAYQAQLSSFMPKAEKPSSSARSGGARLNSPRKDIKETTLLPGAEETADPGLLPGTSP